MSFLPVALASSPAILMYHRLVREPVSTPHSAASLDPEIDRLVKLGRWADVVRSLDVLIGTTDERSLRAELLIEIDPENGDALPRLEPLYERRKEWKKLVDVLEQFVENEDDLERREALGRRLAMVRAVKLG